MHTLPNQYKQYHGYMDIISAVVLGIVQGLTEFIPVSSSGHMIIAERVFGVKGGFEFDVLLNIGTLLALLVYYRRTILALISEVVLHKNHKLAVKLVVAVLPAIAVGYFFDDFISGKLQSVWVVITMLIVVGLLMVLSRFKPSKKTLESISLATAVKIGVAQIFALIPGTSRSGITILAGQSQGLSAKEAARFSFILGIPTISGAIVKVALSDEARVFFSEHLGALIIGNIVSFVSGSLAVAFLINMLGRRGLRPFGWYRLGFAALLIALIFGNII